MKYFLAITLVFNTYISAIAAPGFYAICSQQNQSGFGFCTVDTNGLITPLSTSSMRIGGFGEFDVDPINKKFYLLATDSVNFYVLKFDITSGQIDTILYRMDSLNDGNSNFYSTSFDNVFYNCVDNSVYFSCFTYDHSTHLRTDSFYISKVNLSTGILSRVKLFRNLAIESNRQLIDFTHQKFYYTVSWNYSRIYSYDLMTGDSSCIVVDVQPVQYVYQSLVLNPADDFFYGVEIDNRNITANGYVNKFRILKIDPLTGSLTYLSIPTQSDVFGNVVLNLRCDKLYLQNVDKKLFSYDLKSGILSSVLFTNSSGYKIATGLCRFDYPLADTGFTSSDYCQSAPTKFETYNKVVPHIWNFGDPLSGANNSSTLQHAEHTYSSPGTYHVQMISATCDAFDTTNKTITIDPFPEVNLGDDRTICSNKEINPIELNIPIGPVNYMWQDGSTGNSISVASPGSYWVSVSAACGTVSDTMNINSTICPCNTVVYPTLTSDFVHIRYDCDYTNSSIHFEIFDVAGKKIYSQKINEHDSSFDMRNLSNGIYFYNFSNSKNESLNSGKIIMQQ